MDDNIREKTKSRKKKTTAITKGINRKVAHNAVESRRKLKISKLVEQLSSLVDPSCHCGKETKVDVLQKVVKRIQELEKANEELKSTIRDNRLGNDTQLQEQLTSIMSEHISLLIKYHCHQTSKDSERQRQQIKHVSNPQPSANERCGFGVADLLETCSHQPAPSSNNRPIVGGGDHIPQYLKHGLWLCSSSDANTEAPNQMTIPNSTYSLSPWQQGTTNHLNGGESLWEHNHASFQLPTEVHHMDSANSYYSAEPHSSQFMSHDTNPTSVSSNVWRPYNDPSISHSQQSCSSLSNQMNTSFLVEQLLEKLL